MPRRRGARTRSCRVGTRADASGFRADGRVEKSLDTARTSACATLFLTIPKVRPTRLMAGPDATCRLLQDRGFAETNAGLARDILSRCQLAPIPVEVLQDVAAVPEAV